MEPTNKYPIFEPDQVLTSRHLNDAIAYLESHDRHSRRLLHGIGIVCGLEVRSVNNSITVSRGVGISSKGYLIYVPNDLSLNKVRDYFAPKPPVYTPFSGDNGEPLPLLELIPAEETEGENIKNLGSIPKASLINKVIVLYLEMLDEDLKSCTGNDCDNKGKQRRFRNRVLLVDSHLVVSQNGSTQNSYAGVKPYRIPRFDVTATAPDSSAAIMGIYQRISLGVIPELAKHLALSNNILPGGNLNEDEISKYLHGLLGEVKNKRIVYMQYFYDYLSHLAEAANELYTKALELETECCPDKAAFPRHLMLTGFQEMEEGSRPAYRNYFIASQSDRKQYHIYEELKFLRARIGILLKRFEIHDQLPVRITPGKYGDINLSQKAVPYYLQKVNQGFQPLLNSWNYKLSVKGLSLENKHYFLESETDLKLDHEGYNFYRIEGHIGRNYREVLKELSAKFKTYRLPADLVALRLSGPPGESEKKLLCNFHDLDSVYEGLISKLLCGIQREQCYFAGLNQAGTGVRAEVASVSTAGIAARMVVDNDKTAGVAFDFAAAVTPAFEPVVLNRPNLNLIINALRYQRGDFLKSHCTIRKGSVGEYYLELIKSPQYAGRSMMDVISPYLYLLLNNQSLAVMYAFTVYPLVLIDSIERIGGEVIRESMAETDTDKMMKSLSDLVNFVKSYRSLLEGLDTANNPDLKDRIHKLLLRLSQLESLCLVSQFRSLFDEYQRRARAILQRLHFATFLKDHPGINFKAGVPKGGTFIIVYHGAAQSAPPLTAVAAGFQQVREKGILSHLAMASDLLIKDERSSVMTERTAAPVEKVEAKEFQVVNKNLVFQQLASQIGVSNQAGFLAGLDNLIKDFTRPVNELQLVEGTVVADFYLPYLCASECMPVQLNFPEDPAAISLPVSSICVPSDEDRLPFLVSPAGGTIAGEGVELVDNQWFFFPARVSSGRHTFIYTVGERSVQTSILIQSKPVADFSFTYRTSPNGTELILRNQSLHSDNYRWELGDGSTSDQANPTHFYPPDIRQVSVVLRAFNQLCESETSKDIDFASDVNYTLRIGQVPLFCGDDRREVEVQIFNNEENVGAGRGVVEGRGISSRNRQFFFNPAAAGAGLHTITYSITNEVMASLEVSVINPLVVDFEILRHGLAGNEYIVHIANIIPDVRADYQWQFDTNEPFVVRNNNNEFTHSYPIDNLKPGTALTITLRINSDPCSGSIVKTIVAEYELPGSEAFSRTNVVSRFDQINRSFATLQTNAEFLRVIPANSPALVQTGGILESVNKTIRTDATYTRLTDGADLNKYIETFAGILSNLNPTKVATVRTATLRTATAAAIRSRVEPASTLNPNDARFLLFGINYNTALELAGMQNTDLTANSNLAKLVNIFSAPLEEAVSKNTISANIKAQFKLLTDSMVLLLEKKPSLVKTLNKISKLLA